MGGAALPHRKWRRRVAIPLAAVFAWVLVGAPSTQATIVTVGSPLTVSFENAGVSCASPCTAANQALGEPGANVTSPVSGVIVRWRTSGHYQVGPFELRVLRPASGGAYTGVGTSSPVTPAGSGTQIWTTNLPIKAGDLIGIDDLGGTFSDVIGAASVNGSAVAMWTPRLADGFTATPGSPINNFELGFNADVAATPSNADTLGKVKLNKKNGTATLSVNVPGPGSLSLSGKNVKPQRLGRGATASKTVTAAGTVKLLIRAKGKAKVKLNKTGKAKVKVTVTYTPAPGDAPGTPNTQTKTVKLVKKLR